MTAQSPTLVTVGLFLALALLVAFACAPLSWMLLTSLKTEAEALRLPITLLPHDATIAAYGQIWRNESFGLYFLNSTIVSISAALLSTILGALAGYGFSRFQFHGRGALLGAFLATQMLSGAIVIGPYYQMAVWLGLYDSRISLIIAFITVTLPFATWMSKGYFDSVPRELDEAAIIDGASHFTIFWRVAAPLAMPGMVATLVFAFLLAWQDLLWAMVLTSTPSTRVVTLAIASLIGEFRVQWPMLMAGSLVGALPSIILYVALERYLVGGLTAGSVKG